MKKKVIIIGAGIGGMATANLLAKAGYEVHVYERQTGPGGRAGLLEEDGFRFDTGPSWYLMPEVFEHYFSLLGTTANDQLELVRLDPSYKVFFESADPITIRADIDDAAEKFDSIEPGAGASLRRYVAQAQYIYEMSLKHFLYTNVRSLRDLMKWEVLKNGPKFAFMALTSFDRHVSRYFKDARLKQILEYSMVFLGASPYKAPAIYSLMGALDFDSGVYYPKGGIYALIEAMQRMSRTLGVTYYYGAEVCEILVKGGAARGVRLASGDTVDADIVISNADMYHTETKLLAPELRTYPESYWNKRTAGPSALLVYAGVKGELPEIEHHSLLFVDDWEGNFDAIYGRKRIPESASIYVSRASATDEKAAPKGHEALVLLVPLPAGVEVSRDECEALADKYIRQVGEMTGVTDLAERIVSRTVVGPGDFKERFYAWQNTALGPSHTLRQTAWFRMHNKSRKVDDLYYVGGSTIPGVGLPMCVIGAELIYKYLAGDVRGGRVEHIEGVGKR